MSKFYKEYPVVGLGGSDAALLNVSGGSKDNMSTVQGEIKYGEDGEYSAHIVDENVEIPSYYRKEFECYNWLKIADDDTMVFDDSAKDAVYTVYRAGMYGTIIQRKLR